MSIRMKGNIVISIIIAILVLICVTNLKCQELPDAPSIKVTSITGAPKKIQPTWKEVLTQKDWLASTSFLVTSMGADFWFSRYYAGRWHHGTICAVEGNTLFQVTHAPYSRQLPGFSLGKAIAVDSGKLVIGPVVSAIWRKYGPVEDKTQYKVVRIIWDGVTVGMGVPHARAAAAWAQTCW